MMHAWPWQVFLVGSILGKGGEELDFIASPCFRPPEPVEASDLPLSSYRSLSGHGAKVGLGALGAKRPLVGQHQQAGQQNFSHLCARDTLTQASGTVWQIGPLTACTHVCRCWRLKAQLAVHWPWPELCSALLLHNWAQAQKPIRCCTPPAAELLALWLQTRH